MLFRYFKSDLFDPLKKKKDSDKTQISSSHWQVQDNHVFSVSPRSGTLLPGQQRAVHFSYRSAINVKDAAHVTGMGFLKSLAIIRN